MRREVSCEGDRGKATRVATRFDAVAEITDDHYAGPALRLECDKHGTWMLWGYDPVARTSSDMPSGRMRPIAQGTIIRDGFGVTFQGWEDARADH